MRERTLLLILFMLVSVGCAHLEDKQIPSKSPGPTAVVTKSLVNGGLICRVHDPVTGLVIKSSFYHEGKYVEGTEVEVWVCDGEITADSDPETSVTPACRKRTLSSEFFGFTNPTYSCGNFPCFFWP